MTRGTVCVALAALVALAFSAAAVAGAPAVSEASVPGWSPLARIGLPGDRDSLGLAATPGGGAVLASSGRLTHAATSWALVPGTARWSRLAFAGGAYCIHPTLAASPDGGVTLVCGAPRDVVSAELPPHAASWSTTEHVWSDPIKYP